MAETNGLLNRRTGKSGTEGSNPSVSASLWHVDKVNARDSYVQKEKSLAALCRTKGKTAHILV